MCQKRANDDYVGPVAEAKVPKLRFTQPHVALVHIQTTVVMLCHSCHNEPQWQILIHLYILICLFDLVSYHEGMEGWFDRGHALHTEMVYLPTDGTHLSTNTAAVNVQESKLQPVDCKSASLTVTLHYRSTISQLNIKTSSHTTFRQPFTVKYSRNVF